MTYDVAIVGGGIVGLATAMALTKRSSLSLIVLEAENQLAAHQTGHNSGVVHSGLYYKPGSGKARNCVAGRKAMERFCQEQGLSYERCGKLVVAIQPGQLAALKKLQERGLANGLAGLRYLSKEEVNEFEPHVLCEAALLVPETGIVDFPQVALRFAQIVVRRGGEIRTKSCLFACKAEHHGFSLETRSGLIKAKNLINCGGLQSDRIAKICGLEPNMRIVPFRGEYYELNSAAHGYVRNLVYPVPDDRFPFLGVHFTRMIHGGVEAGPNAVLTFRRDSYRRFNFSFADTLSWLTYPSFWKMAARFWRMGLAETWRSFSKKAFVKSLQSLIPAIESKHVRRGSSGVRAQALAPGGIFVDDFLIVQAERMVHILNAPSPAATASIHIGEQIAEIAEKNFNLH
jgi:L-2-hydroxyglutarate oxidase